MEEEDHKQSAEVKLTKYPAQSERSENQGDRGPTIAIINVMLSLAPSVLPTRRISRRKLSNRTHNVSMRTINVWHLKPLDRKETLPGVANFCFLCEFRTKVYKLSLHKNFTQCSNIKTLCSLKNSRGLNAEITFI